MPRAAVITVSDACARGEREDLSGAEARRLLAEAGFELAPSVVVADERPASRRRSGRRPRARGSSSRPAGPASRPAT